MVLADYAKIVLLLCLAPHAGLWNVCISLEKILCGRLE